MAKRSVKCLLFYFVLVLLVLVTIPLYLSQIKTAYEKAIWSKNLYLWRNDLPADVYDTISFNVDELHLKNGTLELNGHFIGLDTIDLKNIVKRGLFYFVSKELERHMRRETEELINRSRVFSKFSDGRKVKDVNCRFLLKGDREEMKKADEIMAKHEKDPILPEAYINMTKNCSEFVTKREYITNSLTKVEKEFPISYSILMYKDIEQSERLLRSIYRPQNLYCIHVDLKSSDVIHKAMSGIANCFDNVFIPNKSYKVLWGTMSVLEPELSCMEELRNRSKSWKYFINLTGQEFPLKTNYALVQILKAFNGANDIEGSISRTRKERWKDAGKPPHDIVPLQGSVHIVASRGFVDFVLDDHRARDFLKWSNLTMIPDETFFATLNHNPKLGVPGSYKGHPEIDMEDTVKPYVARFKNWGKDPYNWTCEGKRVREICIFGIGDLPMLAFRRELFANKFFLEYKHFALDCLEELHFNRTRDEFVGNIPFDNRWYSKLGFVLNKVD